MQHDNINGQEIESVIISEDGIELPETIDPKERDLLAKIDTAIRTNGGFIKAFPGAKLVRIDSNRGLADQDEGRFYLRYLHEGKGGVAEFWGNAADVTRVDIDTGFVGVSD